MAEWTWTDSQRRAIDVRDAGVIVSAAAGSGKTAVLAERCATLVADGRCPCAVDRLLVVTFTDAAAAEMRHRIAAALRERLARKPTDRWLQRQIALLDAASISTIHAFCRRTLQRFFAHANLDPYAPLMDANDAALLLRETAQRVVDRLAERRDARGEAFLDFLVAYGRTDERPVIGRALAVDAFLTSLPDPEGWIEAALARFSGDATLPAFWHDRLVRSLRSELAEQLTMVRSYLAGWREGPPSVAGSIACMQDYEAALTQWAGRLEADDGPDSLDPICIEGIGAYAFPTPPRKTKKIDELPADEQRAFAAAAQQVRDIRSKLYRARLTDAFGRFTTADWAEGIARTRPHLKTFLFLVQAIRQAYQAAKRDLGVLDFADLERMTLDLLRDDETGVAARLRDHYEHVLVDEFQDVNPVQAEIIRLISRESGDARADNLFVVGDVKQSIYRFRLAEPRLFLARRTAFLPCQEGDPRQPAGVAVDLVENFRSRRPVIDAINAVFERLMATDLGGIEYGDQARLKPGRTDADTGAGPGLELHVLDDAASTAARRDADTAPGESFDWERIEREAYVIAQRIDELRRDGVAYGDIVILMRAMAPRAALFVRTLSRLGVPVTAEVSGGFFEALEVQDLLSLLALLDNRRQDIPLASVLRSPLFGAPLTDSQLAEIKTTARASATDLTFHAAVSHYAQRGPNIALRSRLTEILQQMDQWRQRVRRRPLADVLWEVYEQSGYLAFVSGLRQGRQRRANLLRLHAYARQFASFKRQGLYRFLRFIDALRSADRDLDAGAAVETPENVVRVMTIHRSKGLEFPVVFVAELGKRFNLADARGAILFDRALGVALEAVDVQKRATYPTLPHRMVSQAAHVETLAEEMRILYVALTRARERIILVGTTSLNKVQQAHEQYADHHGPLPLLARQTASSALDWVLPAICCQPLEAVTFLDEHPADGVQSTFTVRAYQPEAMRGWAIEPPPRSGVDERLKKCSRMEPLPGRLSAEPVDAVVETVARRVTTVYPAHALTRVPAVAAASVLKRRWDTREDDEQPAHAWTPSPAPAQPPALRGDGFRPPACLQAASVTDAAALGTWTHEFLQRLDLRRPCDARDLSRQMKAFVDAGAIAAEHAARIDLDAVAWFFSTPLAARLRLPAARVLREWPFVLGVDPARYDPSAAARSPEDKMLVRGIIDCLFDAGEGWEIIDYKTDAVSGDRLVARAEEYRGQLQIYAAAVDAVWQQRVARRWLVFLSPREIVEV